MKKTGCGWMQGKEVRNPQGAPKGKAEKSVQAERLRGLTPSGGAVRD